MTGAIIPEFETLPSSWSIKRLEELIEPGRKISYGIVQPGFHDDSGVPIIRVNNIKGNRIIADDVLKVSTEVESQYKRTRIRGGELLITLVGSLGEVAIAEDKFVGWNLARAVGVIPIASKSEAEWVKFYLSSRIAKYFIGMWANTTVQHTLNLKDLAQLPVPMPPASEREALVEFLGALDEKIELNRKQNHTLEAIAQALFKHWFVDFEFPDENGNPYKSSGGAMRPSELGEIPVGWKTGEIYDVANVLYGFPFKSELFNESGEGLPLIRIRDLKNNYTGFFTTEEVENRYIVQPGDLLVGMDAEFKPHIWMGGVACLNQRVCKFAPNDESVHPYFVLGVIKPWLIHYEYAKTGTTVIHLGKGDIDQFEIVVPSREILTEFCSVIDPIYQKLIANNQQSQSLAALRDALLPKLMSGELRVA